MNASRLIAALALSSGLFAQGADPLAPVDEGQLRAVETRLAELRDALVQHSLGLRVSPSWFRSAPLASGTEATSSRLEDLRAQIRSRRTLLRSVEPNEETVGTASTGISSPKPRTVRQDGELTTAELVQQALDAARAAAAFQDPDTAAPGGPETSDPNRTTDPVEEPPIGDWAEEPLFDGTRVTSEAFAIPRDAIQTFVIAALRLDREAHRTDDPKRQSLLRARRNRLCALVVQGLEPLDEGLRTSEVYALARAHELTDGLEEAAGLYRQLQVVPLLDEDEVDHEPERKMFRELARAGLDRIGRARRNAQRGDRGFSWPRIQGVAK